VNHSCDLLRSSQPPQRNWRLHHFDHLLGHRRKRSRCILYTFSILLFANLFEPSVICSKGISRARATAAALNSELAARVAASSSSICAAAGRGRQVRKGAAGHSYVAYRLADLGLGVIVGGGGVSHKADGTKFLPKSISP
jgi:hypothetical protein